LPRFLLPEQVIMRANRLKFCDVVVYLPAPLFDVLAAGAERHGDRYHLAYERIEEQLRLAVVAEAERLIRESGEERAEGIG
jgi:hypothetical protein